MQKTDMMKVFLRLAEMSDEATDEFEKLQIQQLSGLVASTVEMLVEKVDEQVDQDAKTVQELLAMLALESGEFVLPVPEEQLEKCRGEMQRRGTGLDEGFVATVKAYMQKASEDGMESMVDVLRCLLQTFAAERLRGLLPTTGVSEGVQLTLTELLSAPPEGWDGVLAARLQGEDPACSAEEIVELLQDKMGEVVLGMPAGSAVQSVIAEYLNELLGRVRALAAEM